MLSVEILSCTSDYIICIHSTGVWRNMLHADFNCFGHELRQYQRNSDINMGGAQ